MVKVPSLLSRILQVNSSVSGVNPLNSFEQLEIDVYSLGRLGNFQGALDRIGEFETATMAEQVDRLRAALLRGQVLHTRGQIAEAATIYQRVAEGLVDDPRTQSICYVELQAAANYLGDLDLAEIVAQRALQLVRRRPEAKISIERIYVNYALTWQLKGDHLTAIDWFRRALRRLEDSATAAPFNRDRTCGMAIAWYGLAKSYVALGDLVKARFAIEGINCDRSSVVVNCLGALAEWRLHHRLRAWDRAERWADKAAVHAVDPFMLQEVLLARALTAHSQGNLLRSREYVEQLNQLPMPLSYEIRSALAALTWKDGM